MSIWKWVVSRIIQYGEKLGVSSVKGITQSIMVVDYWIARLNSLGFMDSYSNYVVVLIKDTFISILSGMMNIYENISLLKVVGSYS